MQTELILWDAKLLLPRFPSLPIALDPQQAVRSVTRRFSALKGKDIVGQRVMRQRQVKTHKGMCREHLQDFIGTMPGDLVALLVALAVVRGLDPGGESCVA